MKPAAPSAYALRVSALSQTAATAFAIRPDPAALRTLAENLDLLDARKVIFSGEVVAAGDADWRLTGKLGATVVQPCAVTLEPVTTRIDVPVSRLYQRDFAEVEAPEAEMPEDDSKEPLGTWIDPEAVMHESLALNLPLFPRKPDAVLGEMVLSAPGVTPMRDADVKPFAGLAGLKARLKQDDTDGDA
ncbi:MAG: DUF177 domain-containing protein [Pseudomonadota bacterium]